MSGPASVASQQTARTCRERACRCPQPRSATVFGAARLAHKVDSRLGGVLARLDVVARHALRQKAGIGAVSPSRAAHRPRYTRRAPCPDRRRDLDLVDPHVGPLVLPKHCLPSRNGDVRAGSSGRAARACPQATSDPYNSNTLVRRLASGLPARGGLLGGGWLRRLLLRRAARRQPRR